MPKLTTATAATKKFFIISLLTKSVGGTHQWVPQLWT